MSNQPLYILKENTEVRRGKDALRLNIEAVKVIAEAIKTTLGPRGLNKMIIDGLGDIIVSNDGAKILEEISVENPAAKMIVDLSKTIHKNVGDGASSTVIFIGNLMEKTDFLLDSNLPPSIIYDGYNLALNKYKEILNNISINVSLNDSETMISIALTALNSKNLNQSKLKFASLANETAKLVKESIGDKLTLNIDNIQFIKKEGGGLDDSKLIQGIVVDKEVVNPVMPKMLKNPKIALVDGAMEIVKTDYSAEIQISNPDSMNDFLEQEENILKNLVEAIHSAGANVVFCQKGIDEGAQHYLAKYGIMGIRRIKHSDMVKLSKATGAKIITEIRKLTSSDLGKAGLISEKKIGKDNMIFLENCEDPHSCTILLRGGSEQIVDDAEIAVKNVLSVLKNIYEYPFVVGGGGSSEVEIRKQLKAEAEKIGGKQQIAIEAFADALESIPSTLAENAGMDSLDILTSLRSKIDYARNQIYVFDATAGGIVENKDIKLFDSSKIKKQIFSLATELAILLIRVDKYIRSTK